MTEKITAWYEYDKYHLHEGIDGYEDAQFYLNQEAYWKLGHKNFSLDDIEYSVSIKATATLIDHNSGEAEND